MRTAAIIWVLFLSMSGLAQEATVDSLRQLIRTASTDKEKIEGYVELAAELRDVNTDSSLYFAYKAQDLLKETPDTYWEGRVLNLIGVYYYYNGLNDSAVYYIKAAADKYAQLPDKKRRLADQYNNLSLAYSALDDQEKNRLYLRKSQTLYEELNDTAAVMELEGYLANSYLISGMIDSAYLMFQETVEFFEQHDQYAELRADAHSNFGRFYFEVGEYKKALEFFIESERFYDSLGLDMKKGILLEYIGETYDKLELYDKSIEMYQEAAQIWKKMGIRSNLYMCQNRLGNTYELLGELDSAIYYYNKSIDAYEKIGDKFGLSITYYNLGAALLSHGRAEQAKSVLTTALELKQELGLREDEAKVLEALGEMYLYLNQPAEAKNYLVSARSIYKELGQENKQYRVFFKLARTYHELGEYKMVYPVMKRGFDLFDSTVAATREDEVMKLQTIYETQKKDREIKLLSAEAKIAAAEKQQAEEERKRQETQIFAMWGGIGLVLILSIISFIAYRNKRKSNKVITAQRDRVEKQKEQISLQKELVEEKNREIIDSINYAKRLQDAKLPAAELFENEFDDHFIFFKPKDIVSGDFYWFEKRSDAVYYAAADCTGHGVPGAMVSIVCSNALTKAVQEENITDPGKILDRARELVIEHFSASSEEVRDGMDIALVKVNRTATGQNTADETPLVVEYAGANNPLWVVKGERSMVREPFDSAQEPPHHDPTNRDRMPEGRDSDPALIEIKADKQPIGLYAAPKPFTTHAMELSPGDHIYVFSDGFQDQFGGPKGKKFKPANMKKLLVGEVDKPMVEQYATLEQSFEEWKAGFEQLDDVCVLGIKI